MEIILGIVLLMLLGGAAEAEATGNGNGNGNGNGPPVKPSPGPGGNGKKWPPRTGGAIDPSILDRFDFAGNGLYIDPNCQYVLEGARFFDIEGFFADTLAPTLESALAIEGNTAAGFIDYLIDDQGITDPIVIAQTIVREVAPMCADVDPSQWGPGLTAWYNDFLERVVTWVEWSTGEIPFGDTGT